MASLHLVNASPWRSDGLEAALRSARRGDVLLLIEDGVYAALADTEAAGLLARRGGELMTLVLIPDVQARGLQERLAEGIDGVDYAGFVALAASTTRTVTWT